MSRYAACGPWWPECMSPQNINRFCIYIAHIKFDARTELEEWKVLFVHLVSLFLFSPNVWLAKHDSHLAQGLREIIHNRLSFNDFWLTWRKHRLVTNTELKSMSNEADVAWSNIAVTWSNIAAFHCICWRKQRKNKLGSLVHGVKFEIGTFCIRSSNYCIAPGVRFRRFYHQVSKGVMLMNNCISCSISMCPLIFKTQVTFSACFFSFYGSTALWTLAAFSVS
jgi:hypothetical protein